MASTKVIATTWAKKDLANKLKATTSSTWASFIR